MPFFKSVILWKVPILLSKSCFSNSSERFSKVSICEVVKVNLNEVFVGSKKWNTISPLIGDYFCGRETLFCNSIREFKSSFC